MSVSLVFLSRSKPDTEAFEKLMTLDISEKHVPHQARKEDALPFSYAPRQRRESRWSVDVWNGIMLLCTWYGLTIAAMSILSRKGSTLIKRL